MGNKKIAVGNKKTKITNGIKKEISSGEIRKVRSTMGNKNKISSGK